MITNARKTVSNVPLARKRLLHLRGRLKSQGSLVLADYVLYEVLPLLYRRKPIKPYARAKAKKVTAEYRDAVKQHAKVEPFMSHRERGQLFGMDGGRISEILQGDYDELVSEEEDRL